MGSNRVETEKRDSVDFEDGSESVERCEDIVGLLPNDPFGMEFNIGLPSDPFGMEFNIGLPRDPFGMDFNIGATVAAITGWIEDFGLKSCGFESDGDASEDKKSDENRLFAEVNFVWTSSMKFEHEAGEKGACDDAGAGAVTRSEEGSYSKGSVLGGNVEGVMCFGSEKYENEYVKDYGNGDPADALFFALGYLGVEDLLSVEKVCKSFRDAVQNDPLLWRHIQIDGPLSAKITDEHLLRLAKRAQGTLRSLSLIKCSKITNNGLKHVLDSNRGLTKLSVPGCIKLQVENVLHDLKLFKSVGMPGVKHLRIGGLVGTTVQQLKEFKLLLGVDEGKKTNYKPRLYTDEQLYLPLDDERSIDIEICPRCEQARQVYDCPVESCQVKPHTPQKCRACLICVPRCMKCGCCLEATEYEETFCLDFLCLDCLALLFSGKDKMNFSPCFQKKTSYQIILYG